MMKIKNVWEVWRIKSEFVTRYTTRKVARSKFLNKNTTTKYSSTIISKIWNMKFIWFLFYFFLQWTWIIFKPFSRTIWIHGKTIFLSNTYFHTIQISERYQYSINYENTIIFLIQQYYITKEARSISSKTSFVTMQYNKNTWDG